MQKFVSFNFIIRVNESQTAAQLYKAAVLRLRKLVAQHTDDDLADMIELCHEENDESDWKHSLHAGDQVYWSDPDDGKCSRNIVIGSIEYQGTEDDGENRVVVIQDRDGGIVECILRELS